MPASFQLQFPESELSHYASQYDYPDGDRLNRYYELAPAQGYLTREQFLDMVEWKSKRRLALAVDNSPEIIEEQTGRAFAAQALPERMRILTALPGVWYPVASVLLHFGSDPTEPIIDRRALWSLGHERPPRLYTVGFWQAYVQYCRDLAFRNGLTVRTVDKALWAYARLFQPVGQPGPPCGCV